MMLKNFKGKVLVRYKAKNIPSEGMEIVKTFCGKECSCHSLGTAGTSTSVEQQSSEKD